jgi:hypothetical protein
MTTETVTVTLHYMRHSLICAPALKMHLVVRATELRFHSGQRQRLFLMMERTLGRQEPQRMH